MNPAAYCQVQTDYSKDGCTVIEQFISPEVLVCSPYWERGNYSMFDFIYSDKIVFFSRR